MKAYSYYFVNGITAWRILVAPLVIFMAFRQLQDLFKWFLVVSFLTDAVDGYLARRYGVTSKRGAILDSIGDDLTVGAAIAGMIAFKMDFIRQELSLLLIMAFLYVLQLCMALVRYRKMTGFHTWFAKAAAILQGVFLLLLFFLPGPAYSVFYIMTSVSILDLLEEIALVILLSQWETNVKGLYWVIKRRKQLPPPPKTDA
ncbi:MAG: CDP-alcohol phosphatidyltransferase family protein [Puia sp.]|nr:CDP-alcohol phosphatidyltransferase family protein [Puia sp.]